MNSDISTDSESTLLDRYVDRLYGEEVLRIISTEILDWGIDPDKRAAIERALLPDFWSRFDAADRRPVISDHDPLDRFQPSMPNDMRAVMAHNALRMKFDELRRRCFMSAVHPLIQQIASGETLAFGRREPVETADQAWVELPYGAMQDQHWRMCRGLSRMLILNADGAEVSAFREVHLRARPASSSTAAGDERRYTDLTLKLWLQTRVASFSRDVAPPSGEDCFRAAKEVFIGLTRANFRRIRRASVPPSWQKKGQRRPPKKTT
jgi:hypothetical protein